MSENGCSGNCGSCSSKDNCGIRKEELNKYSKIGKVIGIVSGKGGVGKSTVTSLIARKLAAAGYKVGIMDADLTGPSIPRMFGASGDLYGTEEMGMEPMESSDGIKLMSMNFLLETEESTVILRGPVLAGVVKQFWTDVKWGDVDYMFVDMPPGTGDVPLTIFQSIPLDGIVIVASPQDLVAMIVNKAVTMANMMNIPILGVVENMSYVECPDCKKKIYLYGESHIDAVCSENGIPLLGQIPISPDIAHNCDMGLIEDFTGDYIDYAVEVIEKL